jgi:hypothetical protein
MASQEWSKRWGNLKIFVRDTMLILSGALFAIGLLFCILGALSVWFGSLLPLDMQQTLAAKGNRWDLCLGGLGLLIAIFAGYYFVDCIYKRAEFNRLYNIVSREKFIKNRDKLEQLAFELSTRHEKMVQKKIREMKLK